MSFNLVVWAWTDDYSTSARRRRRGVKYADIMASFVEEGDHPAMREFDFTEFEAAVEAEIGPEQVDGPYILERYPRARVYNMPFSQAPRLVPLIGAIARRFGLTSAEA